MIIVFAIFILVHGLIHLLGFAKGFKLAEVKDLDMPVTPLFGFLWLMAFILHSSTAGLILLKFNIWWITGLAAVALSSFLIFNSWQYAKYGTLPNIIILVVSILGWAEHNFNRGVTHYAKIIINNSQPDKTAIVTESMIVQLPEPLQLWMRQCGIIGQPIIHNARIRQECSMKMTPDQKDWTPANAIQYVSVDKSSFVWKVRMNMFPFIDITGRDMLLDGKGSMKIKILSLLPVVDADGAKMDEGTLQRYMCEAIWYPSAFLNPAFSWQTKDSLTIEATYTLKDLSAKATFHFDSEGKIRRMSAMRYQGDTEDAERREWIIDIQDFDTFNEVMIPSKISATWKNDGMDWKWLEMEVKQVEYNIGEI